MLFYRCSWLLAALLLVAYPSQVRAADGASAALRPWDDYRTIMWIGDSAYKDPAKLPLFFERLKEMGINTAMVYHGAPSQALLDSGLPYYVENIVNRGLCLKFNSKVTDWDRFVTGWAKHRDQASLVRDYSLDDPGWLDWATAEMRRSVRENMGHHPLAYDIRDELSVTISANPFDYDFSPVTLDHFRGWLRTQYQSLAALNAEWETTFTSWSDVKPFTTDQVKARMASGQALPNGKPDWTDVQHLRFDPMTARQSPTRWNFAPWADFRTYMDVSLARALDQIRQAAHAVDPETPVGIEGTQMPSAFGGYDLWRLSQVLDWVEPYDIGNAREIFASFMPGRPVLTTIGESDAQAAARRLWHLLLLGDRGCLVWWSEDSIDWKSDRYDLTPRARSLAPVLKEMTSPLAQLFLRAQRQTDPIAIHYSQPSIQVDWLLESTVDGSTWLRRFSSFEAEHNRLLKVRNGWLKALQDLGYNPVFIASEQIEAGALNTCRALVLPGSLALSDAELARLRDFHQSGGTLFCESIPGIFDQHGKLRPAGDGSLFELTAIGACTVLTTNTSHGQLQRPGSMAEYAAERLKDAPLSVWPEWIQASADLGPKDVSVPPGARVGVHRFKLGGARLLALERNANYQMSEDLKQAGGNELLAVPIDLPVRLAHPAHVYNLRTQEYFGLTDAFACQLDPWRPSLYALLDERVEKEHVLEFLQKQ